MRKEVREPHRDLTLNVKRDANFTELQFEPQQPGAPAYGPSRFAKR